MWTGSLVLRVFTYNPSFYVAFRYIRFHEDGHRLAFLDLTCSEVEIVITILT